MRQAIGIVGVVNLVLFAAIAGVCVRQWIRHRSVIAMWAALAFVSLATVAGSAYLLSDEPGSTVEKVALRTAVVLLVLFPYLLYRFAAAFEPTRRPLARYVDVLTSTLVVATIALPHFPSEGDVVAVVVRALRARLPRSLVGAAAARRDQALAGRQVRGERGAPADADARARVDRAGGDAAGQRRCGRESFVVRAHGRPARNAERSRVLARLRPARGAAAAVAPTRAIANATRDRRADGSDDGARRRGTGVAADGRDGRRPRNRARGNGRRRGRRASDRDG